ncbi:MAG TPA: FIST N-terminal domain-containing protein [Candidatus Binatia bacterium]|jgi:small ligand-binding sensory domain FIST|nr:FIST N-terminal domain-containing protein [Candidatus Binatia bacterium]
MGNPFSIAAHWSGDFDEAALQKWTEELRRQLEASQVSLGLVFMAPRFFPYAKEVLEIFQVHARIPLLAGCSSQGLIVGGQEVEQNAGLTLGLYALPGADLKGFHFTQEEVEEAKGPGYWRLETGLEPNQTNGWLTFIDPFHLDSETWLRTWNEAYAPLPVLGGLASGDFREQTAQVYLNGEVLEEGGVAISVGGDVRLAGVTSQGCTPIGQTWTLTKVEQNVIHEIGNRPAYEVLAETFNQLPPDEQKKASGNLFIGLVVNEYLEDFHRGDFLIRNLLAADPRSGSIAVGALPRLGQTVQFQRRSAAAATEDMNELLTRARGQLGEVPIYGGCLCCCNGRGKNLFGRPNHDAQMVQQRFGPLGLAGFFCNGEIGPVGQKSFLHGYTASLALFVRKS